ncbi:hypothetical protein C8258_14120 [Nocardia sp. MDA0666]|nr:DUF202 domain-containing protein [Nocardia sp. MDA0666]PSR67598.1 hypothetical protein C8258_14120 [Nocardia sp. MDA0666]
MSAETPEPAEPASPDSSGGRAGSSAGRDVESSPGRAAQSSSTPAAASSSTPAAASSPAPAEGPDLDYRFTLAGERTFLAWIRTALGLLAGGVAVHELVQPFGHHDIRSVLAISCIVLSAVIALGAFGRWRLVGAAMRAGRPLPNTVMVPILAIGIAVIALLAGIGLLLS